MEIKWIKPFKSIPIKFPVFIIHTDRFIPKRYSGYNVAGFIILIRNKSKNDIPLLKHELTHSKQFFKNPILYSISMLINIISGTVYFSFFDKFLQKAYECELEAYANQLLEISKISIYDFSFYLGYFSYFIVENYNFSKYLKLTEEEVTYSLYKEYTKKREVSIDE